MSQFYLGDKLIASTEGSDIKYNETTSVNDKLDELNSNFNVRYNEANGYIQLFYSGEWHNWVRQNITENELNGSYLYYRGTDYTDITGGWHGEAYYPASSTISNPKAPAVNMLDSYMECVIQSGAGIAGTVFSGNAINLSNYDYIEINYTATDLSTTSGVNKTAVFKTIETKKQKYDNGKTVFIESEINATAVLDVRDLDGEHYLAFYLALMKVNIYSIRLVPKS